MIFNACLIALVFITLLRINKEHTVKLNQEKIKLVQDLKNKHMIPRDEVATAYFDDKEVLWILVKDKDGKEIAKRDDGNSPDIEDDYEYQYIRDNTQYPI